MYKCKNIGKRINRMKRLWFFLISLVFGVLWVNHVNPCYAQKPLDTLTLLYTNNINGEIDPCPS
jgi:hypothetical protein